MIQAVVGSGGKTTLIHRLASEARARGEKVLVTTTTHMKIEPDTLLTGEAGPILQALEEHGYAMAGVQEGEKIRALPPQVYQEVCAAADLVLVEADGSRGLPLKFPGEQEPVIPDNADEILVVCGLAGLGRPAREVCHRLDRVTACLGITEDTAITPAHVQRLVTEGYLKPLRQRYPDKKVVLMPRADGSLYQRAVASLLALEQDVSVLEPAWFIPQPVLIICGAGHVGREVAALAAHLDFTIRVMDERADLATPERFPTAHQLICDSYDHLKDHLEPGACYVVVTPNHHADYQCVSTILPTSYTYLGMIGSKGKVASTFQRLEEAGFDRQQIDTIFAPIGLPIGAVTPAEIAFSILAQIIQQKNQHHVGSADRSLLETREKGTLCIVIEKHGSVPRGVGSMMLVTPDQVLGTIGGGESEYRAICHAREHAGWDEKTYGLHYSAPGGLDMACGGQLKVLFLPV